MAAPVPTKSQAGEKILDAITNSINPRLSSLEQQSALIIERLTVLEALCRSEFFNLVPKNKRPAVISEEAVIVDNCGSRKEAASATSTAKPNGARMITQRDAYYKHMYVTDEEFRKKEHAHLKDIGIDVETKFIKPCAGDTLKEAMVIYKTINSKEYGAERDRVANEFKKYKEDFMSRKTTDAVVEEVAMPKSE